MYLSINTTLLERQQLCQPGDDVRSEKTSKKLPTITTSSANPR